ncbi:MAG: hypothetical protein JWO98_1234 [Frankiales bacterium]|nr:hypothetical protein [Frankiales bacterium]
MTEPSGADLARQMLRQAAADARQRPTGPAKKPVRRRVPRGGGRDPQTFGGILDELATAYGWKRPSAGGLLMARWPQVAPGLARHCTPDRYDPDTRVLHLRPVSNAAATKLRMEATRIAAALNDAVGPDTVAAVRVLPVGAPTRTAEPAGLEPATKPRTTEPSVRTRAEAAPGYHRALEAAQAGRTEAAEDPDQEMRDRYFADVRGVLREPEEAFTVGQAALEAVAPPSRGNDLEEIRQAAIKRARDERAGRAPAIPTAFQRTA